MTSVLVVDDDAPLRKALTRELRANGYDSIPASGYDEAIQRLREQAYDVLLTDLRMGDKDGLDLISALGQSFPTTRPILMSAYATARDSERALGLGAVRVLCKPFDSTEMLQAVERAAECTNGFFGSVHGLSLIDMLQMFHYAQRSVTVRVLGGAPAAVHMQRGQIVHATHGATEGEEALMQILTLPAGSLQTSSLEPVAPTLNRAFQPLLLDLLRCLDERCRPPGSPVLPPTSVEDGVAAAPGRDNADASALAAWSWDGGRDATPAEAAAPAPESPITNPNRRAGLAAGLLLTDACQRTIGSLAGDLICAVVDLDTGSLLGCHAANGDAWRRSESLATVTSNLFQSPAAQGVAPLLAQGTMGNGVAGPEQRISRLELTFSEGQYMARTTRRGRRVMVVLAGRGADLAAVRTQLDAVFPLVEALVP